MIMIGVSGWDPGCPGQSPESCKMVVVVNYGIEPLKKN